jgi:germination protein M
MVKRILAAVLILSIAGVFAGLVMRINALQDELAETWDIVRRRQGEIDALMIENGHLKTQIAELSHIHAPVYFLAESKDGYDVVPELRLVKTDSDSAPVISALISEMIDGPSARSLLQKVFPERTRLLGVEVIDGVAYVDFSGEILDQSVGSPVESAMVEAIVRTVVQVAGVSSVQILVSGETVPSLAGHVDVSQPISLAPL